MFFDPHAEAAVRAMWGSLEARGVRSMATVGHCQHRPHVSLLVAERISAAQARSALAPLSEATDLVLRLGSVAVFPGRAGVLYLSVVPTLRLLRLHRTLHTRLAGAGVESGRHYLPDAWVPHCTLAPGLSPEQIPNAVQAIKRLRPTDAQVASVGIVDTDNGAITTVAEPPHSGRAD
jgi:2'-5' RNA ligase